MPGVTKLTWHFSKFNYNGMRNDILMIFQNMSSEYQYFTFPIKTCEIKSPNTFDKPSNKVKYVSV